MVVKLAELHGPALLGHLALGPCHGTHQQCQVAEDLLPLGLVLGEQAVSGLAPRPDLFLCPHWVWRGSSTTLCHQVCPQASCSAFLVLVPTRWLLLQPCGHPGASTVLPAPLTDLDFHCWSLKSTKGSTAGQLSAGSAWH